MREKAKRQGFTLVEILIVVVIIGLLAAMAIPAFNKVREESRRKQIVNNLRQVASAGQQYILEKGVASVPYSSLSNGEFFQNIKPVSGEDYASLSVDEKGGVLQVTTATGANITYAY